MAKTSTTKEPKQKTKKEKTLEKDKEIFVIPFEEGFDVIITEFSVNEETGEISIEYCTEGENVLPDDEIKDRLEETINTILKEYIDKVETKQ